MKIIEEFHYCQWNTTDQVTLITITATYEEYKGTLVDVIADLVTHSCTTRCQTHYLKMTKESL